MKSFLNWVENEENPSLAGPQHKRGETNLNLDGLVERRVRQIIMDLESSGKGTQQEILNSLKNYLDKRGISQPKAQDSSESPSQEPQGVVGV
jgi:hypothetical protein